MALPPGASLFKADKLILVADLDLLKYVENKFAQEMVDNEVTFGRPPTSSHVEFYVYGPTHIAVCIYRSVMVGEIATVGERLELLVLKKGSDSDTVDRAVKEMLNMIRKKKEAPIERRLKR